MNWAEMVVAIVALGTVGGVLKARYGAHKPSDPVEAGGSREREEINALKERIHVLERVITDNHGSKRLNDEIERLRDR